MPNREIAQILEAADRLRAASDLVADRSDLPACEAVIASLDALETAAEALRRAPRMPSVRALWERRVTVETMLWPNAYFDANYQGEALAELVEELNQYGTTGIPRAVTEAVCQSIRAGGFAGLIARVSMHISEGRRWTGVIAAEDFETLATRAAEWGSAVLAKAAAQIEQNERKAA